MNVKLRSYVDTGMREKALAAGQLWLCMWRCKGVCRVE